MSDFGLCAPKATWVIPNDRQLALRAKLKTGWSIKTNQFNTYPKPAPISEKEHQAIVAVIKRAEELELTEQQRVGKLVDRLESLKRLSSGTGIKDCVLCGDSFGLAVFGRTSYKCNDCKKAVCRKCVVDISKTSTMFSTTSGVGKGSADSTSSSSKKDSILRLCKLCSEQREFFKKSGAWFYKGVPKYILPAKKNHHHYHYYNSSSTVKEKLSPSSGGSSGPADQEGALTGTEPKGYISRYIPPIAATGNNDSGSGEQSSSSVVQQSSTAGVGNNSAGLFWAKNLTNNKQFEQDYAESSSGDELSATPFKSKSKITTTITKTNTTPTNTSTNSTTHSRQNSKKTKIFQPTTTSSISSSSNSSSIKKEENPEKMSNSNLTEIPSININPTSSSTSTAGTRSTSSSIKRKNTLASTNANVSSRVEVEKEVRNPSIKSSSSMELNQNQNPLSKTLAQSSSTSTTTPSTSRAASTASHTTDTNASTSIIANDTDNTIKKSSEPTSTSTKSQPKDPSGEKQVMKDQTTELQAVSIGYGVLDLDLLYDDLNQDLKPMDKNGLSDPYCLLKLVPARFEGSDLRTKTVHRTTHPVFNESLTFYGVSIADLANQFLHIKVMDEDRWGKDCLGCAKIPLQRIRPQQTRFFSLALEKQMQDGEREDWELGRLLLSLYYQHQKSSLLVRIIRAENLPAFDRNGTSDPFVKVRLIHDSSQGSLSSSRLSSTLNRKFKTSVKWKTLNPEFQEEFAFKVPFIDLQKLSLAISVWDKDIGRHNDYIGGFILSSTSKGQRLSHWNNMLDSRREMRWHILCPSPIPTST